jgi:hypothetical protein
VPREGESVTVPADWNLVLDVEETPVLEVVNI